MYHKSCRGVIEILEAPEARHERRSKGIEVTELCWGNLGARQQYDEITTRIGSELWEDRMFLFYRSVVSGLFSLRGLSNRFGSTQSEFWVRRPFVKPHNYLLIPQSCGISTENCTYTFGISLLIPKPHDKLPQFRSELSRGILANF